MVKDEKRIKLKIKAGDTVKVIAGDQKGKQGTVVSVDAVKNRAIVEGVNMVKRHVKPTAQDPQSGGIIQKEAALHISNLVLLVDGNPTPKVGIKKNDKGKNQRYSKQTQKFI
jgi:large subunit ribosomal protein L24